MRSLPDEKASYIVRALDDGFDDVLPYARTDEEIQPVGVYWTSDNQISVRTLDLAPPFDENGERPGGIVQDHFTEESADV